MSMCVHNKTFSYFIKLNVTYSIKYDISLMVLNMIYSDYKR